MSVVLKFSAFSNITYGYEYDTGYSRDEWNSMTDTQRDWEMNQALWNDIDCWDEDGPEEDCE
ncbi:hypothetical protein ACFOOK_26165 [Micromonospora krabiensis]|uniref:Uncharacterized protein n=1 Tax=Micromonospora krabiensis TaxID=307121 RepID=A0A1C3N5T3_9ACTN|nr:hypothetical protein [Micromonospora krabiensis]SBV27949.1 hypothetical protein GA0070620_3480 [Micromonospora krabiensis]